MKCKCYFIQSIFLFVVITAFAQPGKNLLIRGNLFIIGGGERSPGLMKTLITTARLSKKDHIVILPMAGETPDTSFYYIQQDLINLCPNVIANFNFNKQQVNDQRWLDSLQKAKLIFITGGDQNRFMEIVLHTPIHDAIITAYANGATIAGTSAGAAVMSKLMITGNEFSGDSVRTGAFKKIQYETVEVKEGLGLLQNVIVDQHFIARSRYNRLLSVLAAYPNHIGIGVDEGTAIIVHNNKITVTGGGQVIKVIIPTFTKNLTKQSALVNVRNVRLDILTAGDVFSIKPNRF